jgi:hypothetical protein
MFIFVVHTLQNKWNEICMKQLAGGKHIENDCFPRTLKFEMCVGIGEMEYAFGCNPKMLE